MDVVPSAQPEIRSRSYTPILIFVIAFIIIAGLVYYFFLMEGDEEEDTNNCGTETPTPSVEEENGVDDVSGLTARYTRDTYDSDTKTWKDVKGGNAFTVSGALTAPTDKNYLTGTTVTRFTLPASLYDRSYTVFTVSKYNGTNKKRIFTSSEGDWYSGHNAAMSGVAKHDDVLTEEVDRHGSGWVVSCDQRNLYRANGTRLSGFDYEQGLPADMGVNISVGNESDFAIGEIIVFSRELSTNEIEIVEKALMDKYVIRASEYFMATLTNDFVPDMYDAEVDCGPRGALNTLTASKHSELEKHRYQYKCMMQLDPYQNQEYETRNTFREREPSYMENMVYETIDCDLNAVRGFKVETGENNKTRLVVKCSSGTVDEATCVKKNSEYQPLSDMTAHDVNCGEDDEVVTAIRLRKDDQDSTRGRYEFTCCKPKGY